MPVDSCHPEYLVKLPRWQKNRDAYVGEDAVKPAQEKYLTRPGGFRDADFLRYVTRAKWYGATARTAQGLTGAIDQKDPLIIQSKAVEQHLKNVTLTGISGRLFSSLVLFELMLIGRYGILLDYNDNLGRPYWCGYPAENIINWRVIYNDGDPTLNLVITKECYDEYDDYDVSKKDRYRVHHLNDDGEYEVIVFQRSGPDNDLMPVHRYIPTKLREPLDFIPFQFFGTRDLTPDISHGLLDALVDVNYAYYRHSADYEHGLFLTGVPTPVISGYDPGEETLALGSLTAWILPPADAKAYLLEYQGHGLETSERAMQNDKIEMATLGARLLEEQPTTAETLGAVQIRHAGESGNLKSVANRCSEGLTNVLRWHHWWANDTESLDDEAYSFVLNTDFDTTKLDPQEIQSRMLLYQGGVISKQRLWAILQQGEIVPNEVTFEEEQVLIENEGPMILPFGDMPADTSQNPQDANNPNSVDYVAA